MKPFLQNNSDTPQKENMQKTFQPVANTQMSFPPPMEKKHLVSYCHINFYSISQQTSIIKQRQEAALFSFITEYTEIQIHP